MPELAVSECSDKSVALQWTSVAGGGNTKLYRGAEPDFAPDEYHLLTTTRGAAHTDDGLSPAATTTAWWL